MQEMSLTILAPERRLIQNEPALSVLVTTSQGEIQILPGHANLVATLASGRMVYTLKGEKQVLGMVTSGFVSVEDGKVTVIAETIELAGEIDINRAKEAQQKAQQMLTDASLDPAAFRKYQLKLERAIIRQNIAANLE